MAAGYHRNASGLRRKMQDKLEKIFAMANNALYFCDNHDFITALYDICLEIKPEEMGKIGKKYIEENGVEDT